jgi:hypothetical protein
MLLFVIGLPANNSNAKNHAGTISRRLGYDHTKYYKLIDYRQAIKKTNMNPLNPSI